MKILTNLILLSFISNTVFAVDDNTIPLNKGQLAPYDGVLFSVPKATELRNVVIERNGYKLLNDSYKASLDLSTHNVQDLRDEKKILIDQNINLTKAVMDSKTTSNWERLGYFVLGVVAALGAAKVAIAVLK